MTTNHKAQMEIMGLAIVVILLIIGMLFVVSFVVLRKPSSLRDEYTSSQLASNTLSSLIYTTSDNCKGFSINELMINCAEDDSIVCGSGERACAYTERVSSLILNSTLVEWNIPFKFTVQLRETDVIAPVENGDCSGERESYFQPLPTDRGDLIVRLDICR